MSEPSATSARNTEIAMRVLRGEKLRDAAAPFALSGERARQICIRYVRKADPELWAECDKRHSIPELRAAFARLGRAT